MPRRPSTWALCALLASACSGAAPPPSDRPPDPSAPPLAEGVPPPRNVPSAAPAAGAPDAERPLGISWPDLRQWLLALPSEPIPFREQSACESAPEAPPERIDQSIAGARIIASVERVRTLREEQPPLVECMPSSGVLPPRGTCRMIHGFLDIWILSFGIDGAMTSIERDHLDQGCGLGRDGVPSADALLATDAVLDLYHRSTWNPDDDPDYDGPTRSPLLRTGEDARRALYESISCVQAWTECAGAERACVSGGCDRQSFDIHWRADGSAAIVVHYDAGSPSSSLAEMTSWSRRELRRFRGMLALPFDAARLPADGFDRAEPLPP